MGKRKTVILIKNGNMLLVNAQSSRVKHILRRVLTYKKVEFIRGRGTSRRTETEVPMYNEDHKGRFATCYGYWKLIRDSLTSYGYRVRLRDKTQERAEAFEQFWENISQYKLRDNQPEFLEKILKYRCGRFDCPPGFGKSFMIGVVCAVLPRARVHVVTRRIPILRERIYPELVQMVGDVGIMCSGQKKTGHRVMCYSVGMLHKVDPKSADILIADEVHELASDKAVEQLVRWQNTRNYGLSASQDMRVDNKDFRLHGLFGPIVHRVSYAQAQAAKMVVPIRVRLTTVESSVNPCSAGQSDTQKKRFGYWQNDFRNSLIAEDARRYPDDVQTLITVETLEHAVYLKSKLPEYTLVYSEMGLKRENRNKYVKAGLISAEEPEMTTQRRVDLTQRFEDGRLKKAIATTVWNVGVSFNGLSVIIRADGASGDIGNIQIPGRVSRTHDGKEFAILHDYRDVFDKGLMRKSQARIRRYNLEGWDVVDE